MSGPRRARQIAAVAAFLLAVLAYLWLLAIPLPWTGVALPAAVALAWWRRRETVDSLGLSWKAFLGSFRAWALLWASCALAFLVFGHRALANPSALERGVIYFAWSAAQLLVFQSMTYVPLRGALTDKRLAASLAGLAFALVHAPNPVLVPATLVWGIAACLLFERCRSVWGLALLQVMLSSMLMWATPPRLHHGFRIGPYYYQVRGQSPQAPTFAPPIENPR
ncbi:MAG TPA: hypothetical protein VLH09_01740 [Bryobacteraceae bacterium]|nr:hypothetical protein [Bryobacteraceae bacterium]